MLPNRISIIIDIRLAEDEPSAICRGAENCVHDFDYTKAVTDGWVFRRVSRGDRVVGDVAYRLL